MLGTLLRRGFRLFLWCKVLVKYLAELFITMRVTYLLQILVEAAYLTAAGE